MQKRIVMLGKCRSGDAAGFDETVHHDCLINTSMSWCGLHMADNCSWWFALK